MTPDENRAYALGELRRLAVGIREASPAASVERLLERVAAAPGPEKLRALLAELGAGVLLGMPRTRPMDEATHG